MNEPLLLPPGEKRQTLDEYLFGEQPSIPKNTTTHFLTVFVPFASGKHRQIEVHVDKKALIRVVMHGESVEVFDNLFTSLDPEIAAFVKGVVANHVEVLRERHRALNNDR